jgi:hypothetical protein
MPLYPRRADDHNPDAELSPPVPENVQPAPWRANGGRSY